MNGARDLRVARDTAMECQALNVAQHKALCNLETPEYDSLVEHIALLARYDVPRQVIDQLMAGAAKVMELNTLEGGGEHDLAGALDRLLRCSEGAFAARIDIKGAARKLRAPLNVLAAEPNNYEALCAVDDVVASCTDAQLRSHTLAKELGRPPYRLHGVLLSLLGDEAGAVA